MTKVKWPMFSLGARKATTVPIDDSGVVTDKHGGIITGFKWPVVRLKIHNRYFLKINRYGCLLLRAIRKVVYREQPTPNGRVTIRQKYVIVPNPRTNFQQENRNMFADAVTAWQDLSYQEEIYWNKLKYPEHMAGFNRFISHYMKTHTPTPIDNCLLVAGGYKLKINNDFMLRLN